MHTHTRARALEATPQSETPTHIFGAIRKIGDFRLRSHPGFTHVIPRSCVCASPVRDNIYDYEAG